MKTKKHKKGRSIELNDPFGMHKKNSRAIKRSSFSKKHLLVFAAVFAVIGGYLVFKAFADTIIGVQANGTLRGYQGINSVCNNIGGFHNVQGHPYQCVFQWSQPHAGSVSFTATFSSGDGRHVCLRLAAYPEAPCSDNGSVSYSRGIAGGSHFLHVSGGGDSPNQTVNFSMYGQYQWQDPPPPPPQQPTVDINASPTTIQSGQSSTLSWTSNNASSCNASGAWSGAKPLSGQESTGALNSTRIYTLTCSGPGGSVADSATVTVTQSPTPPPPPPGGPPPPGPLRPTVRLVPNPASISYNNYTFLQWSSTNAQSCSASWTTSRATTGTQRVGRLTRSQSFSITCTGAGGSATASATVQVAAAPQGCPPNCPVLPPPPAPIQELEAPPPAETFTDITTEEAPAEVKKKGPNHLWNLLLTGLVGEVLSLLKHSVEN